MRHTFSIISISLLLPLSKRQEATPPVFPEKSIPFVVPSVKLPAPMPAADTASLKQGSWYSNALKNIEESEYQFTWQEENKAWSTPNRNQNLRFHYTEEGFTVAPRTTKIPIGKYDPMAMPGKIKYRYLPDWKATFELDKTQAGNGNWQVNDHTAEYITPGVTIQYINNKDGMRQNFIVQKPLQQKGELQVNFGIKTKLKVTVQNNRLQFFHNKKNVLNYQDLNVWDACGKKLNAYFDQNKKGGYTIHVDDTGATYPVTIDPVSTTPAAVLESNQATAYLGTSVSGASDVNGDGYSDVIVGAYGYDNGQTDEGAAFIYHGSATGVTLPAAAMVESNQVNASLGWSVANAGDVNGDGYGDVAAGATGYTNGQSNEGGVYVYYGSAAGINTTAAAILQSNQANAYLGIAVACAGDVNGDGYSDIVAGAMGYDNGQANEGAAFIYHGSAAGINTTAAAMVESNQVDAQFGYTVSSAGDVNGDGYSDIITCAPYYGNGELNEGAAFVYHGSASGINTTVTARLESNQVDAFMGAAAGAGDVNGDGYSDVIVGAYFYNNGQSDEGAAFVYHGSAAGINTTFITRVESNQAGAYMGSAVACAGDVNGDGYSDVIVGAYQYDNGENNEGAAFIYQGSASGISSTVTTRVESNQAFAEMGDAVACAGDVNGDGYSDIIAGVQYYDNGETNEGAAFVYHGSAAGVNTVANAITESNQVSASFGKSVASAGDVNGDGYSDAIIGAWFYDNGQNNEGAAFVYHGTAAGINSTAAIRIESNQANALMGNSVACAGDVNGDGYSDIIVGAYSYSNGEALEGAAFVYHGSATGITSTVARRVECNQANASMGISVAGAGDINGDGYGDVIVGASFYSGGPSLLGAVFVYHGSPSGIMATANTRLESNQANAFFGISVNGAGDVNGDGFSDIIIGSSFWENGQTDEGAAFIYLGSSGGINTIANAVLESNQANANMGISVASAGDVNGDGFGDVIAGAYQYDNGETDEGAAFIFHGSAAGTSTIASAIIESNQANAFMGISVASAGDTNGDGYSDVVIGAYYYDNGEGNEGAAFIYLGSSAGISTIANTIVESNQVSANLGYSLACSGDINGDGYSDIIIGASGYDNGQSDEGAAFIYHGNNPGTGKRNNLRLYNADLVTPMQQTNFYDPNLFGAGLFAKSPQGRQKGKLVWETVRNGNPFSGTPITNSILFTTQDFAFTDLGLTGTELKHQIAKQMPAKATYIRARVKYDPVTSITGQVYGPWRYPTGFLQGRRDVGSVALPVKFIAFTATKQNEKVLLRWITVDENPGVRYEVQHSTDGIHFTTINTIPAYNNSRSEYEWLHVDPSNGKNHYRIRAVDLTKETFTATRLVIFDKQQLVTVYPNPVKSGTTLTIVSTINLLPVKVVIQLFDMSGKEVAHNTLTSSGTVMNIALPEIPAGQYMLRVQNETSVLYAGKIVVSK